MLSDQPNVQNQRWLGLGKSRHTAPPVAGRTHGLTHRGLQRKGKGGVTRPFRHDSHTWDRFEGTVDTNNHAQFINMEN